VQTPPDGAFGHCKKIAELRCVGGGRVEHRRRIRPPDIAQRRCAIRELNQVFTQQRARPGRLQFDAERPVDTAKRVDAEPGDDAGHIGFAVTLREDKAGIRLGQQIVHHRVRHRLDTHAINDRCEGRQRRAALFQRAK